MSIERFSLFKLSLAELLANKYNANCEENYLANLPRHTNSLEKLKIDNLFHFILALISFFFLPFCLHLMRKAQVLCMFRFSLCAQVLCPYKFIDNNKRNNSAEKSSNTFELGFSIVTSTRIYTLYEYMRTMENDNKRDEKSQRQQQQQQQFQ